MASVIVVDSELKDSIQEYSQIIDNIKKSQEFSTSIKSFLPEKEGEEVTNKSELYNQILNVSTSEILKQLTEKEFEPTFYLLIYILIQLSNQTEVLDNEKSPIFQTLLEINPQQPPSLRDRKSIKSTSILSILSTIFNLLPVTSNTRVFILKTILNVIKTSGIDFNLIQDNIGSNLINWLKETNTNEQEIKSIFWEFIKLDGTFNENSLKLIKNFTHTNTLSTQELRELIYIALSSKTVDVSFLVNNNVAQALSNNKHDDKLVTIFNKYIHGEIIPIEEIPNGLPGQFIHSKSKILSLAKFFADASTSSSSHDGVIFKYNEIPNIKSSLEFEQTLVEAIKAGVIEGKVNQVEETFYLSRVNRFILAGEDNTKNWENVKLVLKQWQNSLNDINNIVKTARENIVNNNTD
ncbi:conserved hypothetical protein [Candida dubliniensis CD36]|uniref:Eukaryotic translation initiation factor 3 subunit M n=1 Tax=Candida dubliniensis (strain CD36 / ATCC MYA-646 / CBS 7987 / NCPF 3949 / NRRL Y-17841) TaxID=573826 RepID=B9WBB2_CANDC|nr:conserved hypothetical protein [Candida dubliniensis CD36]CAX43682.1 conserved hypothetical protein [Candida dubliniensis CD36]